MGSANYLPELQLYIAGEWVGVEDRTVITINNPANGEYLGQLPVATEQDIDRALQAAGDAFENWSQTSAWERDRVLRKAAQLLQERRDHIARVLTLENGKPLSDSQAEMDRVIEAVEWCAEEAKRAYGRVLPPRQKHLSQSSIKRAIGPVGAFAPWNFPIFLAARKLAAALAAGCTVVLKPAEETPGSCIELMRAFVDAGLPAGAANLLYGKPQQISERVIQSPIIKKISFTGSVEVGRLLATQAAKQLKPVTMELGGHAPVIVFDAKDVRRVARMCVGFKFRNAGQVCLSPSRFYVHSSIYREFVDAFADCAQEIRVGDGLDSQSQMGPLNNSRRLEASIRFVEDAVAQGATVRLGGKRIGEVGNFFQPTVLEQVGAAAHIMHEEPFCPIAPMTSFDSFDEVMAKANSLDLGLAAYAFTNDLETAAAFSEQIEAAWIGINNFTPALADAPIGGMKNSGLGYEGGPEGLDAYLHARFISQLSIEV